MSATTRSGSDAAGDATTARGEAPAGAAAALTRSARLRRMLLSERLEFLMEAHNGLSARIVREAGFGGIWASGLSMSAQFGVRDNNEASWTQVVDLLEFMVDASDLPILAGRRHRLREFQQHASPGAQARAARHRWRVYRGQAVPEDEQLS